MSILNINKIYNEDESNKLFNKYLELNSYDKEIVNLFALFYHSVDVFSIKNILSFNITFSKFKNKLYYLIEDGLLTPIDGHLCISREPRELILKQLSSNSEFRILRSRINTLLPEPEFRIKQGYIAIVRDLRLALYSKDKEGSEKLLNKCLETFNDKYEKVSLTIFNSPYSQELINLLPDYLKAEILFDIIQHNLYLGVIDAEPVIEILNCDSHLTIKKREEISLYISWANLNIDYQSELTYGIELVLKKKFEEAYNLFKDREIPDSYLIFFIIPLINLDKKDEIREVLKVNKDSFLSSDRTLYPLYTYILVYLGEMSISKDNESIFDPENSTSHYGLWITLLCSFWLDIPETDKAIKYYGNEILNSIPFLEDEFKKMVSLRGVVSLITPISRWESVLNTLIYSFKNNNTESVKKEERLIWRVGKSGNLLEFTPVIQKLSKNGKWSKGRKIHPYDFDNIAHKIIHDTKDKDIMETLCRSLENDYYYYREVYDDDALTQVLKKAIGKKNLYDEKSNEPISIEEEPLSLVLIENKNDIKIKFNKKIATSEGIVLSKKDDKWLVTFIESEQYPIIELIGKELKVPKDQVAKISEFINTAERYININGDIKVLGKGLDKTEGQTIPQFFIEPKENGLVFKLRAVPGDNTTYFLPGHGKKEYIGTQNGKDVVIIRDLSKETTEAKLLIESLPLFEGDKNNEFIWELEDTEDCLTVLEDLKNNHNNIVINWPKGKRLSISATLTSNSLFNSVRRKREWFEVSGEFEIDKKRVLNLKKIMALSEATESRFIQLGDGEYIALTRELKKEIDTISTFSQKNRGDDIKLHPLALLAIEDNEITKFKESREWLENFKENYSKTFRVPKSSKVELRDYQKSGFLWMKRLSESGAGALLADDMGLGKTVQTIVFLDSCKSKKPSLIIVPASLVFNWYDEINRFAPGLSPHILSDIDREDQLSNLGSRDILITSYGLIQRNSELFTNKKWSNLILDEAQAVKNSMAKRTKVISTINREFTLMTTGTPIENHLGELWSLFNILIPGFLGSYENFRVKYKDPIEKDNNKDVRNRLRRVISPFILRRTKEEVLTELPPKTEINLMVEMSTKERSFYEAIRERAIENIETKDDKDPRFKVLAELTRLRQASCNSKLLDSSSKIESGKLELFNEKISELLESNHQALVFSQFVGHLKLIADFLDNKNIPYFYLDGSVQARKRKTLVDGFQNGEKPLFLISLKAGGSGLNLTAADYIFHMDPWWNPAVEDQASDRAHRIGQERPVTVYRLITSGTIEEQIISLHKEKRELAESLLSDSATSLRLNTDELIKIISTK